jgi:hypothetical protein
MDKAFEVEREQSVHVVGKHSDHTNPLSPRGRRFFQETDKAIEVEVIGNA